MLNAVVKLANLIRPDKRGRRVLGWDLFSRLNDKAIWETMRFAAVVEIDLTGLDILGHDGLVWLASIILDRTNHDLQTYVVLPDSDKQVNFLEYTGFSTLRESRLDFSYSNESRLLSPESRYEARDKIKRELSEIRFITETNWSQVNNRTVRYLEEYLIKTYEISPIGEFRVTLLDPFMNTVREVLHNVAMHGGAVGGEGQGFMSLTLPPRGYPVLRSCFSDVGEGLAKTLSLKLSRQFRSDRDAVAMALLFRFFYREEGVEGLYPSLRWIRLREGQIHIRTGRVLAHLDLSKKATQRRFDESYRKPTLRWLNSLVATTTCPPVPGVHIAIDQTLPSKAISC